MFVRKQPVTGKPSHFRIQVCENVRVGKVVRQSIIKHFGIAKGDEDLAYTIKIAQAYIDMELAKRNGGSLFDASSEIIERDITEEVLKLKKERAERKGTVELSKLREVERVTEGSQDIFGHAFKLIGFNKVLSGKSAETLKQLVIARITQPASKRKTCENLKRYGNFDVSLDHIYRTLSKLGQKEDVVNNITIEYAQSIFTQGIDLLFFDVTTLYFESWNQDDLRDFGYSKDNKFGQVQITLALATNSDGFPIGYKLFPGNKAETSTLIECIEEWKKTFPISNVIFVADRGMFSAKNLAKIQEHGYKFIVACPLRKQSSELKTRVLDGKGYQPTEIESQNKKDFCWINEYIYSIYHKEKDEKSGKSKSTEIKGRLVASYSPSRAHKDRNDRERMIEKTRKKYKIQSDKGRASIKDLVANKGYGKFLSLSCENTQDISLNGKKIEEDAQWDGMHAVFTNTDLPPRDVLSKYRGLWKIEECFRLSKTDLQIRPIYHFTSTRIRGHIALCFMSLVASKALKNKLKEKEIDVSLQRLVEEANSIQYSILEDKSTKKRYKLPSSMSELASQILQALGIKRCKTPQPI